MDTAHKQTDKILATTNKKTKAIYQNAYRQIRDVFTDYYSKIELNGNMTAQEKLLEANKYGRLKKLSDFIVDNLLQTNKDALSGINKDLRSIYQLNYNDMVEQFNANGFKLQKITKSETNEEIKENENPFNDIAINNATDRANLSRSVSNSLITSVLKVFSIGSAFTALKSVFEKNLESSVRIAVTQATRLENTARQQSFIDAEQSAIKLGKRIIKVWNTQEDSRVRDTHARVEGQEAELNEPFYVGGERLMFPGDINGSPNNIINCRCFITYKIVNK